MTSRYSNPTKFSTSRFASVLESLDLTADEVHTLSLVSNTVSESRMVEMILAARECEQARADQRSRVTFDDSDPFAANDVWATPA